MKAWSLLLLAGILHTNTLFSQSISTGQAWKDSIQVIPGRVQCERYNMGGQDVAYHDADTVNNGSGKLNAADGSFLNEFRMKEGVDISYTKPYSDITAYNQVTPKVNQLYVGWTQPGEWIKYTVQVNKTGTYNLGMMYCANVEGIISLDVDGKDATGPVTVPSTFNAHDSIPWRQWHHWNKVTSLTQISLTKGIHVLTLHTVGKGNMNYDYLEFTDNKPTGKGKTKPKSAHK